MIINPQKFDKNQQVTVKGLEQELTNFNKNKDISLFMLVDSLKNKKDVQESLVQTAKISLLKKKLDLFLSKNNTLKFPNLTNLVNQATQQFVREHKKRLRILLNTEIKKTR